MEELFGLDLLAFGIDADALGRFGQGMDRDLADAGVSTPGTPMGGMETPDAGSVPDRELEFTPAALASVLKVESQRMNAGGAWAMAQELGMQGQLQMNLALLEEPLVEAGSSATSLASTPAASPRREEMVMSKGLEEETSGEQSGMYERRRSSSSSVGRRGGRRRSSQGKAAATVVIEQCADEGYTFDLSECRVVGAPRHRQCQAPMLSTSERVINACQGVTTRFDTRLCTVCRSKLRNKAPCECHVTGCKEMSHGYNRLLCVEHSRELAPMVRCSNWKNCKKQLGDSSSRRLCDECLKAEARGDVVFVNGDERKRPLSRTRKTRRRGASSVSGEDESQSEGTVNVNLGKRMRDDGDSHLELDQDSKRQHI